jgi:hypothetical protein
MISQERKNELKNEGKSEELEKKILRYNYYDRRKRLFPLISIVNIIFVVYMILNFPNLWPVMPQ